MVSEGDCGYLKVMSSSQACRTRPYDQHAPYRLGGCLCWGIKRPLVQPVVHLQPLHTPVRHPKSQTERCWNDGPVGAKVKLMWVLKSRAQDVTNRQAAAL